MKDIKKDSWAEILIETYRSLGGEAHWDDVYRIAEKIRRQRGLDWTEKSPATIRDRVQRNSSDSASVKRKNAPNAPDLFYAVAGGNKGIWGLRADYDIAAPESRGNTIEKLYEWGLEGIAKERNYLRRLRNQSIVQSRKIEDDFQCQTCGFRHKLPDGNFVIDVHHLTPLGSSDGLRVTSIDDLVCLCPNCHRIAHSRQEWPLSLEEIRKSLNQG